jgi:hypothetical protein
MIRHGACGKEWKGSSAAHCSNCHETFSGDTLFDAHWYTRNDGIRDCRRAGDGSDFWAGKRLVGGVWRWPAMSQSLIDAISA